MHGPNFRSSDFSELKHSRRKRDPIINAKIKRYFRFIRVLIKELKNCQLNLSFNIYDGTSHARGAVKLIK